MNFRTISYKQFKILTALACFGSLNCTNAKPLKWVKTNNKLSEEYSTWLITATCLKMNRSRKIISRTLQRNANISVSHLQLKEIIPFQEKTSDTVRAIKAGNSSRLNIDGKMIRRPCFNFVVNPFSVLQARETRSFEFINETSAQWEVATGGCLCSKPDTGGPSELFTLTWVFRKRKQISEELRVAFVQTPLAVYQQILHELPKNSRQHFEVLRMFNDRTIENVSCDI